MNIVADTNVLVRAYVGDDIEQRNTAAAVLAQSRRVVITNETMLEFVWVLLRMYKMPRTKVLEAVRSFLHIDNVEIDRTAVEVGLSCLQQGGDFADGVIAYEGRRQGGETFVSFDRKSCPPARSPRLRNAVADVKRPDLSAGPRIPIDAGR
ncbi:type II toxin-antitoxin system VapC family toxin [Rhizobium sp. C4]|uniref:type II toxin-antitoxin system VapC family toxin n=1 Tax=Rhizobium sp. C4 TaxID=1349800 RepID=UPI001E49224C|nr:type II toxin-antitoxin system VapC family toxin [Rhizobium sp. C4]MCD2172582.1 type II toxin-antitoxin system VapC family toxin [Rhizobium sp. C4]